MVKLSDEIKTLIFWIFILGLLGWWVGRYAIPHGYLNFGL